MSVVRGQPESLRPMTYDDVIERNGVVDDLRFGQGVTFYRVQNPDGSLPQPPTLGGVGDSVVIFASDGEWR